MLQTISSTGSNQPTLTTMLCHITIALLALLPASLASKPCPIQGPDFPRPSQLAQDPVFKDVLRNLSLKLDNVTSSSNDLLTDLKANETSYSIAIFDVDSTLLSFHHTADAKTLAPESVSKVTGKIQTGIDRKNSLTCRLR